VGGRDRWRGIRHYCEEAELAKAREREGQNGKQDCDPVVYRGRWNIRFPFFIFLPMANDLKDLLELL
jgi:hypothetical protein